MTTIQEQKRRLSRLRIFDPDHPGQPRLKPTASNPHTPPHQKQPTPTLANPAHSTSKLEALIDLHQQQMEAIQLATITIAELIRNDQH
jgi:hypothetical protein